MIKKKSGLIISILIMFSLLLITVMPCYSMAGSPINNPDSFRPNEVTDVDTTPITEKARPIINIISTFGIIVAVITLIVLGIKYMVGSVSEKAEYKKTMSSYLIGIVFLVCIVAILQLINNLVIPLNKM